MDEMSRNELTREMEAVRHRVLVVETEMQTLRIALNSFAQILWHAPHETQDVRRAGLELALFIQGWEQAIASPGGELDPPGDHFAEEDAE